MALIRFLLKGHKHRYVELANSTRINGASTVAPLHAAISSKESDS